MSSVLIPIDLLSDDDKERCRKFYRRRNLFNKYTLEQLENFLKIDLYEALDLDGYRQTEIPKETLDFCVRKKSTMYHPTKNGGKQQAFLIIRKAQEILSNPRFRRVYDSCFLDESIPEDREYSIEEFFRVFGDVFERNGLFSEVQPIPSIRDSPEAFYRFWQGFKTTRVYDDPDDVFDVSGSSRRYAAEKNKDAMQEKKLKDLKRVQNLVKLSIKCDPRIPKKAVESSNWTEAQLKTLTRLDSLTAKSSNRFELIAKKMNDLYLTKRPPNEIKIKLESIKKK